MSPGLSLEKESPATKRKNPVNNGVKNMKRSQEDFTRAHNGCEAKAPAGEIRAPRPPQDSSPRP